MILVTGKDKFETTMQELGELLSKTNEGWARSKDNVSEPAQTRVAFSSLTTTFAPAWAKGNNWNSQGRGKLFSSPVFKKELLWAIRAMEDPGLLIQSMVGFFFSFFQFCLSSGPEGTILSC